MSEMSNESKGVVVGAAVVLVLLALVPTCAGVNVSSGVRVGVVTKASTNGLLWKTHEAGIALESFKAREDGSTTNLWEFSVGDEETWARIQAAARDRTPVVLSYEHRLVGLPWRGETSFYVTGCEAPKREEGKK